MRKEFFENMKGKSSSSQLAESWEAVKETLRTAVENALDEEESVQNWLEFDLNEQLHYASGLLVLTNKRLISIGPISGSRDASSRELQCWQLDPDITLQTVERYGTASLELLVSNRPGHIWRYTAAKRPAAHSLKLRFDSLQKGSAEDDEEAPEMYGALCTGCGAPLSPEQALCPQCEAAKSRQPFRSLCRLVVFVKPRMGIVLLGLVLQLLGTAASLIPPYLTIPMIDDVLIPYQNGAPVEFNLIWYYLAGLFGAQVVSWLLSWGRTWVLAWASERIAADLRTTTYAHLQRLSIEYFGGKRTGDLISRVSVDTDRICYFLSVHLLDFMSDVLMIVMTAAILIWIDPLLALFTLVPLPVIAFLVHRVRRRLVEGFTQGSIAWSELTNVLADTIPGIRVVKAFAQEHREIERFRHVNDLVLKANDRVNTLWSFFSSIVVFLTGVGVLIVWGFGAWLVFHSGVKVGVLTGFVQYINRFYGRMDSMSRIVSSFQRAGVSAQRVFSILDRVPSVPEPAVAVHPGQVNGAISMQNVSFHYGRHLVLKDVSFDIKPGEMIGLIGPSGAGKSTLINLICRFYDAKEGAICVDGTDIRSLPIEEYRKNIGIVLQEPFLFYGTIAENIAYGKPDAPRVDIVAAARAARAHEFILRLPDGYDSIVGERGQFLSGGERQRISIARALLIDPRIFILDEATSSVDNETEREIQAALENLIRGRTTVAIAHRLSTLRKADRLFVIEHGRLKRIASPQEILPAQDAAESTVGGDIAASVSGADSEALANQGFELQKDPESVLCARLADGRKLERLEAARAFPLTSPSEWVSLLDSQGREVLCMRDVSRLTESLRRLLEHELSLREFVPVIQKIIHADTDSIPSQWQVLTDRGETVFFLENEEDLRRMGEHGAIFRDTHGIRYLIRDSRALDMKSRKVLGRFF